MQGLRDKGQTLVDNGLHETLVEDGGVGALLMIHVCDMQDERATFALRILQEEAVEAVQHGHAV